MRLRFLATFVCAKIQASPAQVPICRVISMGRRNTKLEPAWHGKQKLNSLARVRPAGTLLWLGFHRVQPNRWFFRASNVESAHWMVLHRPVELAPVTVHMDTMSPLPGLETYHGQVDIHSLTDGGGPMNWNKWVRQTHRWLSIAFTVAVIVN